ncbi:RNA-directed DNA polymerase [uncultured Lamprocystis sp.]|jgi:hypothetical protein|uniref:RNA-directed DNA polymerase n=1 Tax=uncultured Lamprocystis sp. TaxID=543132 RepID=UPI0025D95F7F|nr:RNA-directed DNA polymerase [uncultured Lamprocystis sp.]
MKSYGGLFARILDPANLEAALERAARGKRERDPVQRLLAERATVLPRLREALAAGTYRPRPYEQFAICDPKPRRISCAHFRDRVVHHAVCAVLAPLIERRLIADNYACRVGKGSHRALLRAQDCARRHAWFLKTDIRRYYDSIDHAILLAKLDTLCREPALRRLLAVIVEHPIPGQRPGKGLPIGNLTSQWFANLYLDEVDHWIKEVERIPGYVRYMDDLALWADDKERLFALAADLRALLAARLGLELKEEGTLIAPVGEGMPFLGWRVYPGLLRQQGPRLRRQRRLLARREAQYLAGEIGADKLQDCVRALAGPRKFLGYGEPLRSSIDV